MLVGTELDEELEAYTKAMKQAERDAKQTADEKAKEAAIEAALLDECFTKKNKKKNKRGASTPPSTSTKKRKRPLDEDSDGTGDTRSSTTGSTADDDVLPQTPSPTAAYSRASSLAQMGADFKEALLAATNARSTPPDLDAKINASVLAAVTPAVAGLKADILGAIKDLLDPPPK